MSVFLYIKSLYKKYMLYLQIYFDQLNIKISKHFRNGYSIIIYSLPTAYLNWISLSLLNIVKFYIV